MLSIRRLSLLHPRILVPGHGKPLAGSEVEQKFQSFATTFAHETAHERKT